MRAFNVAAVEKAVLVYSPIWMAVIAFVMISGVLKEWGDVEHVLLGVGLALPVCALPFVLERDRPIADRYATRYAIFVVGMTMIQMYAGSWLFFERLGMRYRFHVSWSLNGSPVFLYPLTVAYFATYYVVLLYMLRALPASLTRGPVRILTIAVLSYSVAFAETFFMAAPVLQPYFEYVDKAFMLRWGSICYGTVFFVSVPLAARLGEAHVSLRRIGVELLLCNAAGLLLYELYGLVIARLRG